jgi:hypothetical protein
MNLHRMLLAVLAVGLALNGLDMLAGPQAWYQAIPGVAETGPFNAHFVRDVGCAYLAAALGCGLGAWRPAWRLPGVLTALAFLGLHAGVHLWEAFDSDHASGHLHASDLAGVFAPVLLLVLALLPSRRAGLPS